MRIKFHTLWCVSLLLWALLARAAVQQHINSFGKWTTVKWLVGADENQPVDLKVRALYVDARLKEYTTGASHDVTDRLFVVQRVFRRNDSLPDEAVPRWQWQRSGWLLVDRVTGRVAQIALPEFDPFSSTASWYRDYLAYCGVSDDGKKLFAMVAQLGHRKPILKKALSEAAGENLPDSECSPPTWQKLPPRVASSLHRGRRLFSRSVDVRSTW